MSTSNGFGGVAQCYAFKSRLQEYAQKVGISTPVYDTVMEGPSHEPVFRSTVIVNNVSYHSLPGFYNRKAAEQSAAEIALMEINKSGLMSDSIPTLHATGLCKNLLQEYAQKMNYAIPSYTCKKFPSSNTPYSCTVDIGGIQYIGAAAKTKKEAEIKAARTALLAIQSNSCGNGTNVVSPYTVLPGKKKGKETEAQSETGKHVKPKKAGFKKKGTARRFPGKKCGASNFNKDLQGNANASGIQSKDFRTSDADEISQYAEANKMGCDSGNQNKCLAIFTLGADGEFQNSQQMESNNSGIYVGNSGGKLVNVVEADNSQTSQYTDLVVVSSATENKVDNHGTGDSLTFNMYSDWHLIETNGIPQGSDVGPVVNDSSNGHHWIMF